MSARKLRAFASMPIIVMSLVLLLAVPTFADEAKSNDDWKFNLAPFYLWAVSITGDQTVGSSTGAVDVNFTDIAGGLNAALIFHFEATYKKKWGLLTDLNYLDLSVNGTTSVGIKQDVDLKLTLFELGGYYRVTQDQHSFDFLLGGRYFGIDTDIKLSGGPGPGRTVSADKSWVDPFLGGRWIWNFTQQFKLIARGDIGGFSLGSDISANGAIIVEWKPFKYVGFLLGYRALYIDYKEGSGINQFKFDATMHGPLVGINFNF
jgi:hypothetical protein